MVRKLSARIKEYFLDSPLTYYCKKPAKAPYFEVPVISLFYCFFWKWLEPYKWEIFKIYPVEIWMTSDHAQICLKTSLKAIINGNFCVVSPDHLFRVCPACYSGSSLVNQSVRKVLKIEEYFLDSPILLLKLEDLKVLRRSPDLLNNMLT